MGSNAYIPNLADSIKEKIKKSNPSEPLKSVDIEDVPKNWIVVHFYLTQLEDEKRGYALIYDPENKVNPWRKEPPFKYEELFEAYLQWQKDYSLNKKGACGSLVKLCEEIGEDLSFLFHIQEGRENQDKVSVLFIPHDFLHRLPLHGAIKKAGNGNRKVFLETTASAYLPAWSFLPKKKDEHPKGNYLIKNFEEHDFNKLIKKTFKWENVDEMKPLPVPDKLETIKGLSSAPELLIILCHGKSDATNPFNAGLMLKDEPTYLDLAKAVINLNGSKVILGACETDLVPPLSSVVDEHLSISTSFISKGASEIFGTLWIVDPLVVEDVMLYFYKKPESLTTAIRDYQKDNIKSLFEILAFRIIGFNG